MSVGARALVVMGVSGSGKSAAGCALAQRLGWRFIDGDDFHPPANVAKMRAGTPLNDQDRAPWLARLNAILRHSLAKGESIVIACSALKENYRSQLGERIPGLLVAHLRGSEELIAARIAERRHRYMPASLLRSQFETLEPPALGWEIDISASLDDVVEALIEKVAAPGPAG